MSVSSTPKSKAKSPQTKHSSSQPPETGDISERFDQLADSVLLTEPEVARIVGHSPHTLKFWRLRGIDHGPKPVQMPSASVRYRVSAVRTWLDGLTE